MWCFWLLMQNTGVLTVKKWTSRHARSCPCNSLGRKMALLPSSQTCDPSCFRRTQTDSSTGSIQWILNLLSSSTSLCHVKPSQGKIKPTEPYWKQIWVVHPWLSYFMREHTCSYFFVPRSVSNSVVYEGLNSASKCKENKINWKVCLNMVWGTPNGPLDRNCKHKINYLLY